MINISKSGNAIKFAFTDSDHYLYGSGEIEVPVNSLSLIVDGSNMVTMKKANSNDIFLSFDPANSNLSDKAGVIDFYKTEMVGSTGGGSESGITSGDVETMIDAALADYYTDDEVDAALSGKQDTLRYYTEDSDGQALIAVGNGYVEVYDNYAHMGVDNTNLKVMDTGVTINDEIVATQPYVSASLTGKADTSAVTAVENDVLVLQDALAGKANTAALTAHTSDTGIHVSQQEKNAWNAKAEPYSAGTGIDITNNVISTTGGGVTVDPTLDSGSTNPVANSAITTAIDGKQDVLEYYSEDTSGNTATIHTENTDDGTTGDVFVYGDGAQMSGSRNDSDEGIDYFSNITVAPESIDIMYEKSTGDETTDAHSYLYVNENNISLEVYSNEETTTLEVNDNGVTINDDAVVTESRLADYQPVLSAGTGIEISGNVISATGGGGATYSAGTNISIDTANTINCTLPITANTNDLKGYLLFGNGFSLYGTDTNGRYHIAIGKQISNPAYAQGQVAICPADTSSSSNSVLTGDYPIGIGHLITSRGNGAVAIGDRANANGNNYVAIGKQVNATGTTKMNLNDQIKVDTNNQIYIKDKTNTTEICLQDALSGGGGSVTVDSYLDSNSSNPVENQAIATPIEDIYNALDGSYNDGTQMVKLKRISQSDYDDLVNMGTTDSDTLYIITPDVENDENDGGE